MIELGQDEIEALGFFSAGRVPSVLFSFPRSLLSRRSGPLYSRCLLAVRQQYPQIPQIISRGPGQDGVTEP